ncbi:MAG TPA: VanZ family protein [Gemmataceae bacterium]|nr:VanZ family protein [Gemmataceae bacterium]
MWRWLTWGTYVIAWTVALEVPVPIPPAPAHMAAEVTLRGLFSKFVHVGAYTVLTLLSAWLPVSARYRWLIVFFLAAHATGTEILQTALQEYCGRGGSLYDVGLDLVGMAFGFVITWRWWARPDM